VNGINILFIKQLSVVSGLFPLLVTMAFEVEKKVKLEVPRKNKSKGGEQHPKKRWRSILQMGNSPETAQGTFTWVQDRPLIFDFSKMLSYYTFP
jgi:hypothetical protein